MSPSTCPVCGARARGTRAGRAGGDGRGEAMDSTRLFAHMAGL